MTHIVNVPHYLYDRCEVCGGQKPGNTTFLGVPPCTCPPPKSHTNEAVVAMLLRYEAHMAELEARLMAVEGITAELRDLVGRIDALLAHLRGVADTAPPDTL